MGVADPEKRYNLTWMDRLNLENLVLTSRAICAAAQARTDSRGAHYREDFPETSDLAASRYTMAHLDGETRCGTMLRLGRFTRVRPGRKPAPSRRPNRWLDRARPDIRQVGPTEVQGEGVRPISPR